MLLAARMMEAVSSVNIFTQVMQVKFSEGDAPAIFFQLIDLTLDRPEQGYSPSGRRYMPVASSTLSVVLDNLDNARKVTRAATQPFASDPSIWKIQLLTTDSVRGTVNLKLTLTEPGTPVVITHGYVPAAIRVDSGSNLDSSMGWRGGVYPIVP